MAKKILNAAPGKRRRRSARATRNTQIICGGNPAQVVRRFIEQNPEFVRRLFAAHGLPLPEKIEFDDASFRQFEERCDEQITVSYRAAA